MGLICQKHVEIREIFQYSEFLYSKCVDEYAACFDSLEWELCACSTFSIWALLCSSLGNVFVIAGKTESSRACWKYKS